MHGFGYKSADLNAVKIHLQLPDVLLLKYNIYLQTLRLLKSFQYCLLEVYLNLK